MNGSKAAREFPITASTVRSSQERPDSIDPYWNFVPRAALFYATPIIFFALCLERGAGSSRNFWIPLLFVLLGFAPATWRRSGRPFAHKDFQNRDSFLVTYALLPPSVWFLATSVVENRTGAAIVLFLVLVAHDALALRYNLLCIYFRPPGSRVLASFSLPLWGWAAFALATFDALGRDTPGFIIGASLMLSLPVAAFWIYLRSSGAAPERLRGIRQVVVVGSGWSGLYAVKELHEAGLEVRCFEAADSIGGIWKYRPDRPSGVASSTRATSSKHFLHASDFPLPSGSDDFLHHSEILAYLQSYVDHFGIRDCIELNTEVKKVQRLEQGWRVITQDIDGRNTEIVCDAVVICSGPHQVPKNDPSSDPLYGRFTGRLIHSASYKTAENIARDSTVLVVGAGESSADIVAECVARGAKVHWSSRSGQWFADRNMGPYPADHITTQGTRVFVGLFGNLEYIIRRFVARAFVNTAWGRGGHGIVQWLPDTPYLHQFLNKSRDGILEIYRGNVIPHTVPVRIDGRQVGFSEDTELLEVDTIILATGFRPTWPFLSHRPVRLYKLVFDPDDPTLAFVGFARPIVGSIPSLSELQARWLGSVWSGATALPNSQRRHAEIRFDTRHHRHMIRDSSELGILVDQELYATELATRINAQVHWLKLFLTWPKAFFVLLASPWAAFKYRLNDPVRAIRRRALANIIRELPAPRAPNFLLAVGIGVFVAILLAGTTFLLWSLPTPVALASVGGLLLVGSLGLRLSESDGLPSDSFLGRVREIFPW